MTMRYRCLTVLLPLVSGCSAKNSDSRDNVEVLDNVVALSPLERLQQGDKSLCAEKELLSSVTSILADLSRSTDALQRMSSRGETLSYELISATRYDKEMPELSCSAMLRLDSQDGPMKPLIRWNLRPNLSDPGTILVEASAPPEVASAFWWTMTNRYPDPARQQLLNQLQTAPSPKPVEPRTSENVGNETVDGADLDENALSQPDHDENVF
jgi:hypothetical protein